VSGQWNLDTPGANAPGGKLRVWTGDRANTNAMENNYVNVFVTRLRNRTMASVECEDPKEHINTHRELT